MSWLLFLDESGHDQRTTPCEVHGGFALHVSKLWPFIQAVRTLEQLLFGAYLHEYGSEIKSSKLLNKDRFAWEKQGPTQDEQSRRKNALNFLNASKQHRTPRSEEFAAFGQACIRMSEGLCSLLESHDAVLFAAMIPHIKRPPSSVQFAPRKDLVFLFERYFYFLREKLETGLIVLDRTDKHQDRDFAKKMERYFCDTSTGLHRANWVVPSPIFVESDMSYGVQVADFCVYCLNWGYRMPRMEEPVRDEVRDFCNLLEKLIWKSRIQDRGNEFNTQSVVYVPDPHTPREIKAKNLWNQK